VYIWERAKNLTKDGVNNRQPSVDEFRDNLSIEFLGANKKRKSLKC
jgi:hypothetical protein